MYFKFHRAPSRLLDIYFGVFGKWVETLGRNELTGNWQHMTPRQEKWANLLAVRRGATCVCVLLHAHMEHGLSTPNTQAVFLHSLTAQYLIPPSRGLCESDAGPKWCVVQHAVQNISGLDLTLSVIYCVARDQDFTRTNFPFPIRLYHDAVTAITTEKIRNWNTTFKSQNKYIALIKAK